MGNWFNNTFRKVHVIYVSPTWAKNRGQKLNVKNYISNLKNANIDTIELYAKDHNGVNYYKSSMGKNYPVDVLEQFIKECHESNIKLIAYFSVGFDNFAIGNNPEWTMINQKGERESFSALGDLKRLFYLVCLNSPYYNYALEQIEEISKNYDIDGLWLDIIPLAYGDEHILAPLLGDLPVPCYCINCQNKYFKYSGKEIPRFPNESEKMDFYKFMISNIKSFLKDCYGIVRKYHPNAIITYNGAGTPGDPINNASLISVEGHSPEFERQSLRGRWGKSHEKPLEVLTPGAISDWNCWDQKPIELLTLESSIINAHGGSLTIGQVPYPDGSFEKAEFQNLKQLFGNIKEIEDYLSNVKGLNEVCLLCLTKPYSAPQFWNLMFEACENAHFALLNSHFQYEITDSVINLEKYNLVMIPDQRAMSDNEVEKIRSYVKNGGNLILSGLTSLYTENGLRRKNFALSDVIGADFIYESEYQYNFIRIKDELIKKEVCSTPIKINSNPIIIKLKSGEILGDLFLPEVQGNDVTTVLWGVPQPDYSKSYPGIIINKYGKGNCIYISTFLKCNGQENLWSKRLLIKLTEKYCQDKTIITNAPPGVEIVLNKQKNRFILHLINHYMGCTEKFSFNDNRIVIKQVKIMLDLQKIGKITKVYSPFVKEIPYKITEKVLEIDIPDFCINMLIVIE